MTSSPSREDQTLTISGKSIELLHWRQPSPAGTILLIHEALGSVSYWKDFPEFLAAATGCDTIAYSRAGHGNSEGPVEPRSLAYYQHQVNVVLPAILGHYNVPRPALYGHSEGAGIALLYAASHNNVHAILAECPIVAPESRTGETIRQVLANYASTDMRERLTRYHADADDVFHSWIASHRSAFFKEFPFADYLARIRAPILVMQGARDDFGGLRQYEVIREHAPSATHRIFDAGHLLHRECPDLVAAEVQKFLASLPGGGKVMNAPAS